MSYLDLDAILMEEERLTVVFEKMEGAAGLGFLDSASMSEDLHAGSKVDFPLWLVQDLSQAYPTRRVFNVKTPLAYREMQKIHTEANAKSVDLKAVSGYYYEFGLAVQQLVGTHSHHVGLKETMNKVLASRMQDVLDTAQNHEDDVSEYVGRLTSGEHKLYTNAVQRSRELTKWKLGHPQTMQAYSNKRTKY
ncbi:hypothetical protein BASA82_000456 [Batrachochytrium salamandrivorans]|nr:hypothetical protein BASA81_003421 [Batrachochytrium salamandrivorans]KAH9262474.1 hypothetical protein BASA82_000456 [Batrachochytrium salamandrivorans]